MSIERELRGNWDNVYYPAPEPMVEEAIAPSQQPGDVLVAEVGSRGLPESAYSGEPPKYPRMEAYDPTTREKLSNKMQTWLESMGVDRYKARQNAQTFMGGGSSNLPLTMGIADFIPYVGTGLQTEEAVRLGSEAVTSAQQGNYGTAAVQAGGAALGLIPGVAGTVQASKTLAPKAGEMAIKSMEKLGTPVQMNIVPPSPSAAGAATKAMAPASDIGFYSAVEKAALNVQRNSGSGQSFLNDITKGENVKLDEIKWMGLDDFLKGKKNVTKQEVQDFVQNNRVDVQERELSGTGDKSRVFSEFNPAVDKFVVYGKDSSIQGAFNTAEEADNFVKQFNSQIPYGPTTYDKYQLPGGENYREILLTLPVKGKARDSLGGNPTELNVSNAAKEIGAEEEIFTKGSTVLYYPNGAYIEKLPNGNYYAMYGREEKTSNKLEDIENFIASQKIFDDPTQFNKNNFYSSHFDEPNVLAHMRVNDRVDADGKKMLLIEEVQSDWHQAGREKGYKGKGTLTELPNNYFVQELKTIDGDTIYVVRDKENPGVVLNRDYNKQSAINGVINELNATSAGGVPDAPFKDTWYQLALKRALRYAADNGYDRVGLTTGKQQAERYDLSKQVDDLNVFRDEDGTFSIKATLMSDQSVKDVGKQIKPEQLSEYVGKDLAEQILQQKSGTKKVYSGDDLKVGGEGMKKYYDDVYPKFLQKYGKKWGASVGETQIKTGRGVPGGEPVRYIDITPEMRKSVQKGQPLAAVSSESTVA